MNKEKLLKMTIKEIEGFLNKNISSGGFQSENESDVKGRVIDKVKYLFDNTIKIDVPYYTNKEFLIAIGNISITVKVMVKKTGKTVSVSRLRRKDVKTFNKFKIHDVKISFYNPFFEAKDLEKFTVELGKGTMSGGAVISLKHREEKLIDILSKDILIQEIQNQDDDWKDIRKTVVLSAAQPKLKKEYFNPNFNQKTWDYILEKTEEVNKGIINEEIEKMFMQIF